MTNILVLRSSVMGAASVSNLLVDALLKRWPGAEVTTRDLGAHPMPHLLPESVSGLFGARDGAAADTADIADQATRELQAADVLVIGAPMYNFGIPSTLKTWFDHLLRAGVTFRYTATGLEGLMGGRRAFVVEARGGSYRDGAAAAMDSQEPHLRALLGLMGITDVTFVQAENLANGPDAKSESIEAARSIIDALPLAA